MIQVKRTFHGGSSSSLAYGIKQTVGAKQHLLDVVYQGRLREQAHDGGKTPRSPTLVDRRQVFSAVVSFDDATDREPETYRKALLAEYRSLARAPLADSNKSSRESRGRMESRSAGSMGPALPSPS